VKKDIERLTNRHIAKLLTSLEGSITPLVEQQIKRQIRFLEADILTTLVNTRKTTNEQSYNR
jgi:hypothetical protein